MSWKQILPVKRDGLNCIGFLSFENKKRARELTKVNLASAVPTKQKRRVYWKPANAVNWAEKYEKKGKLLRCNPHRCNQLVACSLSCATASMKSQPQTGTLVSHISHPLMLLLPALCENWKIAIWFRESSCKHYIWNIIFAIILLNNIK